MQQRRHGVKWQVPWRKEVGQGSKSLAGGMGGSREGWLAVLWGMFMMSLAPC